MHGYWAFLAHRSSGAHGTAIALSPAEGAGCNAQRLMLDTLVERAGDAAARLGDLGSVVLVAARDQSLAPAPLTIFAVVAVILLVLMVRTS